MNFLDDITTFKKKHRVLSHILFWVAIYFVACAEDSYQYKEGWFLFNRVTYFALNLITQVAMAYFFTGFIIPQFVKAKTYFLPAVWFLVGSYIICVVSRMINIHIHEPLSGVPPKAFETVWEVCSNIPKLFYIYFIRNFSIAVVFVFIKLLFDQIDIQKRALSLERAKSETELKLLKAQLNPHFLFNTLNNIYSLSLQNSPSAPEAIARLSDILDHILYKCNKPYVPVSTEINLLKNYIELEKLRYDERLQVLFTTVVDDDADIAPLLILSIVENAFKHGAAQDIGSPVINIDVRVADNVFTCRVANSFTNTNVVGKHEKIGLHNLKQQLELLYPAKHTLAIKQTDGLFVVTLIISLQPKEQAL